MLMFMVRKLIQFTFTLTVYESTHFNTVFPPLEKSSFHFANLLVKNIILLLLFLPLTPFTHFSHNIF